MQPLLHYAAKLLRSGGVIAYPTESVYGLGCDPLNYSAVSRLLVLKRRNIHKGFIIIGSSIDQLTPFIANPEDALNDNILATWPGPVTWVFSANPSLPGWLTGYRDTIAIRLTNHPIAATLCRYTQHAIVSSSANITGHVSAKNALQTRIQFNNKLDYIVKGNVNQPGNPTEIRDAKNNTIIRPGAKNKQT